MDDASDLTPSEMQLLRAASGTHRILFGNITRQWVDASPFVFPVWKEVFLSALNANQNAGNLDYQVENGWAGLGLVSRRKVWVHANGAHFAWPQPSLEASIASLVQSLTLGKDTVSIAELVGAWLGLNAIRHFQAGLRWVFDALAERGRVRRRVENRLGLFSLPCYEIPGETWRLAEKHRRMADPTAQIGAAKADMHRQSELLGRALDRELRKLAFRQD